MSKSGTSAFSYKLMQNLLYREQVKPVNKLTWLKAWDPFCIS